MASVLIKLCSAPPLVISTYRLVIAALFYLGICLVRRQPIWAAFTSAQRRVAFISGVFLCIHFVSWITSLSYTSVANSVVLVQTFPVFVAMGGWLILGEKPSRMSMAGIILALIGSVIISAFDENTGDSRAIGNLLAVIGAVGAAGYFLAGRKLRAEIDTLRYVSFVYTIAAMFTLLITLISQQPLTGYQEGTYFYLFAIAMLPQVIGHTSLNWALKKFSATTVSILTLSEPLGASVLAFWILHEALSEMKIIAGFFILCGVAFTIVGERVRT
jgi:drug/metabolite transporter (DMT)-like permease